MSAAGVDTSMDETTVPIVRVPPAPRQKKWLDRALAQVDDRALLQLATRMIDEERQCQEIAQDDQCP